ncbi:hypothetical protein [endosymbiont GvMRE of Glomus versiforme]|uniref:hypothetical protein n=1 Tax=endosymbiont GvMRE of Glomus versiforme TaxID=2039283 RepID=UPI0011C49124|nr:hypothetical protein [endosymbiont GvMRE of Glomus versiforme]
MEIAELEGQDFATELSQKKKSKEVNDFCDSTFKKIVEEGINKALVCENSRVLYNDLTSVIDNILYKSSEKEKLNALKSTLKEIKEKHQVIVAENSLQELVDKPIADNRREDLKADLENLKKLIPEYNSSLNEIQSNAHESKKNDVDNKELKLICALALLEDDIGELWNNFNTPFDLTSAEKNSIKNASKVDIKDIQKQIRESRHKRWEEAKQKVQDGFQILWNAIDGINYLAIDDAIQRLKTFCLGTVEEKEALNKIEIQTENVDWKDKAQTRINKLKAEEEKWKEIDNAIKRATESILLAEGKDLDVQIQGLRGDLFPENGQPVVLKTRREARYKKLKKCEDLITEINDANTWKKLKAAYGDYYNPISPSELKNFSSADLEEIKQWILSAYRNANPQLLIEQEAQEISRLIENWDNIESNERELLITNRIDELKGDLTKYGSLRLPINRGISQFERMRDSQKAKLIFRSSFKTHVGNNYIDNAIIDAYLNKSLNAEQAADAYNYHNSDERIEANEIDDYQGNAEIAGKSYDLKTSTGLTEARQAKYIDIFLNAPGSAVVGANHDRIDDEYFNLFDEPEIEEAKNQAIVSWMKKAYPAVKARIAYDNYWNVDDVLDNCSYNPLIFTKFQVRGIQEVNDYWNGVVNRQLGAWTDKSSILGSDWESKFSNLINRNAVDAEKCRLIILITQQIEVQQSSRRRRNESQSSPNNENVSSQPISNSNISTSSVNSHSTTSDGGDDGYYYTSYSLDYDAGEGNSSSVKDDNLNPSESPKKSFPSSDEIKDKIAKMTEEVEDILRAFSEKADKVSISEEKEQLIGETINLFTEKLTERERETLESTKKTVAISQQFIGEVLKEKGFSEKEQEEILDRYNAKIEQLDSSWNNYFVKFSKKKFKQSN